MSCHCFTAAWTRVLTPSTWSVGFTSQAFASLADYRLWVVSFLTTELSHQHQPFVPGLLLTCLVLYGL